MPYSSSDSTIASVLAPPHEGKHDTTVSLLKRTDNAAYRKYQNYIRRPTVKTTILNGITAIICALVAYWMSTEKKKCDTTTDLSLFWQFVCPITLLIRRACQIGFIFFGLRTLYLDLRRRFSESQLSGLSHLTSRQRRLLGLPPGIEDVQASAKKRSQRQSLSTPGRTTKAATDKGTATPIQKPASKYKADGFDRSFFASSIVDGGTPGLPTKSTETLTESSLTSPTKAFGSWCSPETSCRGRDIAASVVEPAHYLATSAHWGESSLNGVSLEERSESRGIFAGMDEKPLEPTSFVMEDLSTFPGSTSKLQVYEVASRSASGADSSHTIGVKGLPQLETDMRINIDWLDKVSSGLRKYLAAHIQNIWLPAIARNSQDIASVSGGFISMAFMTRQPNEDISNIPGVGRRSVTELIRHYISVAPNERRYRIMRSKKRRHDMDHRGETNDALTETTKIEVNLWKERQMLERFLDIGSKWDQSITSSMSTRDENELKAYVLYRLEILSSDGILGQYKWDGGGRFRGKVYGPASATHWPSDSQIILHYFLTLMDHIIEAGLRTDHEGDITKLTPEVQSLLSHGENDSSRGLFTLRFFLHDGQLPHMRYLMNLPMLLLTSKNPIHLRVVWDGRTYDLEGGPNNLWRSLTFFLFLVDSKKRLKRRLLGVDLSGTILAKVFEIYADTEMNNIGSNHGISDLYPSKLRRRL